MLLPCNSCPGGEFSRNAAVCERSTRTFTAVMTLTEWSITPDPNAFSKGRADLACAQRDALRISSRLRKTCASRPHSAPS